MCSQDKILSGQFYLLRAKSAIEQGLFGSCYFGLGKSVGIYMGGVLSAMLGYDLMWRISGTTSGLIGMFYWFTSQNKFKIS